MTLTDVEISELLTPTEAAAWLGLSGTHIRRTGWSFGTALRHPGLVDGDVGRRLQAARAGRRALRVRAAGRSEIGARAAPCPAEAPTPELRPEPGPERDRGPQRRRPSAGFLH